MARLVCLRLSLLGIFGVAVAEDVAACNGVRAEMLRRQVAERGELTTDPYNAAALGNSEHSPYLRVEGTHAMIITSIQSLTANPSDPLHPMTETHWIDTLWVENQDGEIIAMRRPQFEPPPAKMIFPIPNGTTSMIPYLHCNIHGTFQGPPVTIAPVQTAFTNDTSCKVEACDGEQSTNCKPMIGEFQRLFETEFRTTEPKSGDRSLQHKPNLIVHGNGSATLDVGGHGGKYHPAVSSDNPDRVHFINAVWVYDQNGEVAGMTEFKPTHPSPISFTFDIPVGTTSLTPYAYCNKHGLYTSPTVTLTGSDVNPSQSSGAVCSMFDCAEEGITYARDADCLAIKAVALKRQSTLNAGTPAKFPLPWGTNATNATNTPYVVLEGSRAKVVVGLGGVPGQEAQPVHPMVDDPSDYGKHMHFIETLWVEDQAGAILGFRRLSPSERGTPTLYFDIPQGVTSVVAYALCNKEGLFKGPEVAVAAENVVVGARFGCSLQHCIEGTAVSACQAFSSEFYRRQAIPAAKESSDLEHRPYLTVNGTTVSIVVGPGAAPGGTGYVHPMNYSSDPEEVHYISHIFVTDAFYNLVTMCELLPMAPAATCVFEVPPGVNQLRPHVYCTRHGLFQGPPTTVVLANPAAERMCWKRECSEAQPSLSATAMSNLFVQDRLDSTLDSLNRINTINLCVEHRAVFSVKRSAVTDELMRQVERMTLPGDSKSDTKRRLDAFDKLVPKLKELGGKWHALPEVVEHCGLNSTALRLELLDEELMRFSSSTLAAGVLEVVPGVEDPILDAGDDLLLIDASFAMDWGYGSKTVLNAHYTAFHTINFEGEYVDVALCAKTHGWLGMGWLSPDHSGHAMNHTDITVAYVKDGLAMIEDRFAYSTEEPTKDERLPNQRTDAAGAALNGENNLALIPGALGSEGKEWCPDAECSPGFTLVQFRRKFSSPDAWDVQLPVQATKVLVIFSFAIEDPTEYEMIQHAATSTGYGALLWNRKCRPGTYYNTDRGDCVSCDPGTFQPALQEITSCMQCPKGTFQQKAGQSFCERCKPNFSTASVGSASERSCTCSGPVVTQLDGWYHVPTCGGGPTVTSDGEPHPCTYLGECVMCPEGMICEGGVELLPSLSMNTTAKKRVEDYCQDVSATLFGECTSKDFCAEYLGDAMCGHTQPKLKEGFASLPPDPYSVFLCKDSTACPGGLPGTCAYLRDNATVACGECVSGAYAAGGLCYPCGDGSNVLPFVAAVLGVLVGLTLVALFMNKAIYMRAGVATTAGILAGTTFSALQTMTTFATLDVAWIPSVGQFLDIVGIFSFNPDVVRPGCVAPVTPEIKMLGRVLVMPFGLAWLAMVLAVRKFVRKSNTFMADFANTVGALASVFFIPIVLSFLAPFICYPHPNGTTSMVSSPSILCYEDPSYGVLIAMGALSFIIIACPFLAFVIYGTWKYKENLILQDVDKLSMFRFLFIRFKPDRYYFGIIVLTRNLMICLVPILTNKNPSMQVLIMALVLIFFMLLQVWFRPWRPDPSQVTFLDANTIDAGLVSGCILLLLCGILTTDFESTKASVGTFGHVILGSIAAVIGSTIVVTTWQRFFPAPYYKWTIAHDAMAGTAQARLLKMLLNARTKVPVLLDSEVLAESDVVFDTIRVRTGTLVVYGTRDVLRRQRVAGEITVASNMKVPMVFVRCAEFVDLSEHELSNLEDYLEPSRSLLAAYGMSFEAISTSFRVLLDAERVPSLTVLAERGLHKYGVLADALLSGTESQNAVSTENRKLLVDEVKNLNPSQTVVICSDVHDEEATAVVGVMSATMKRMRADKMATLLLMADCADIDDAVIGKESGSEVEKALRMVLSQARAVLVLLSRSSLRSPTQSFVIAEAMLAFPNMTVFKSLDDTMSETRSNASSAKGSDGTASATGLHIEGMRSSAKLDRVGSYMRKRRQVSYRNQVVVPVVLPGYTEGPTEKWYSYVLPGMLQKTQEECSGLVESARQFYTRSGVAFDPQMSPDEMSLQVLDIWERIPEEGDPLNQQQFSSCVV